jgi:hypothetical protein
MEDVDVAEAAQQVKKPDAFGEDGELWWSVQCFVVFAACAQCRLASIDVDDGLTLAFRWSHLPALLPCHQFLTL